MDPLIERRSPLYYLVSLASIATPIILFWQFFKQGENWLTISLIYSVVLFGIPFLISLLLGFDYELAVNRELSDRHNQIRRGLNWGLPFTIAAIAVHWLYSKNHSISFAYNLGNKTQTYVFGIVFVFFYPFIEGIYYRMYLARIVRFGPPELAKLLVSVFYGFVYYFAFRFMLAKEEYAVMWALIAIAWKRYLFHLRDWYGGLSAMVTQGFANLSFIIIILFFFK